MDSAKDEEKLDLPGGEVETPPSKGLRRLGMLDGQFAVPDNLKEFGRPEVEEMFYGSPDELSDQPDEASPENELKAQA
jgi:hypothetical protein